MHIWNNFTLASSQKTEEIPRHRTTTTTTNIQKAREESPYNNDFLIGASLIKLSDIHTTHILNLIDSIKDSTNKIEEYQKKYLQTKDPKWKDLMNQQIERRDGLKTELKRISKLPLNQNAKLRKFIKSILTSTNNTGSTQTHMDTMC